MRLGCVLCLFFWLHCVNASANISYGKATVSPDGRFVVQLDKDDQGTHFSIKDTKTGHVDNSIDMPTVLLFLRWTTNSKSFVTVEHLAGGSFASLIYFDGSKWQDVDYIPRGKERMEFQVTKITESPPIISLEYAVTREEDNRYPIGNDLYQVRVDLKTGKSSDEKWIPISEEESETLVSRPFLYLRDERKK